MEESPKPSVSHTLPPEGSSAFNFRSGISAHGPWTPVPDPTVLTSNAVNAMADTLRRDMDSMREILEARLDGMDHAITLQQRQSEKVPNDVDMKVSHLQALHNGIFGEKFASIDVQFKERDTRMEQNAKDSKTAVDAALQAAKEAVAAQTIASEKAISKSEENVTKQLDAITKLIQTMQSALSDKNDDLKSRLLLIEGRTIGQTVQTGTHRDSSTAAVGIIGLIVAVVMAGAFVIQAVMK